MLYEGIKITGKNRTHDLLVLAKGLATEYPEINDFQTELEQINDWYIPARYPEDIGEKFQFFEKQDAQNALEYAKKIFEFAKEKIDLQKIVEVDEDEIDNREVIEKE